MKGLHLARAEAVPTPGPQMTTVRRCASCGGEIDPIDYCVQCSVGGCSVHKRPRKRADAAFCDKLCKARYRDSFIRDCVEQT